ncbi:hypothetical protein vseg_006337 [Gypsophila vaccaria]
MLSTAISSLKPPPPSPSPSQPLTIPRSHQIQIQIKTPKISALKNGAKLALLTSSIALSFVGPAVAEQSLIFSDLTEPANALSLPTWAVHVSSVAEWIIAMALVWQYGQRPGNETWKGLSWGMVPLLGGAMCACTWHFFYNAETLEVLVALQAALTFFGNATMCIAAFRIYKSQNQSKNI